MFVIVVPDNKLVCKRSQQKFKTTIFTKDYFQRRSSFLDWWIVKKQYCRIWAEKNPRWRLSYIYCEWSSIQVGETRLFIGWIRRYERSEYVSETGLWHLPYIRLNNVQLCLLCGFYKEMVYPYNHQTAEQLLDN